MPEHSLRLAPSDVRAGMGLKFEVLAVVQLALEYLDLVYQIAAQLPRSEEYNLKAQIIRAGTSISLNIAEGSTTQTDAEQGRFLGIATRSLIETIACLRLIERRRYAADALVTEACSSSEKLFAKLQAFRKSRLTLAGASWRKRSALALPREGGKGDAVTSRAHRRYCDGNE